jgi:SAM-dependent methyltransferase
MAILDISSRVRAIAGVALGGKRRGAAAAPDPIFRTEDFAPPGGVKLNLGSGLDYREGWLNVDLHASHQPDLVSDVTWLRSIEDNSVDYILAQDVLEHIHRARASTAIAEWNRILQPGGMIEIRAPDVVALVRLMEEPAYRTLDAHQVLLQNLFGTQGYEGDFHFNGFTDLTLRTLLTGGGFEPDQMVHRDGWLWHVFARKTRHRPPDAMLRLPDDDAFVEAAYLTRLGRSADEGGKLHFMQRLAEGMPRETVLAALVE